MWMTLSRTATALEAAGDRMTRALDPWFLGLLARVVFASVLAGYFLNSAGTKVGEGIAGFFMIRDNAYYQILPSVVEGAGGDVSQIALLPWGIIVALGTYAEFILPILIVVGLFTRLAALGMIGFVAVQTVVDILFHMVDAQTIGTFFDRAPDATIADQRLLWLFVLAYLALKGPGTASVDALLARRPSMTPASATA